MNTTTRRLAILATVLFIAAVVAIAFFVREINIESTTLSEQIEAIQIDRAQQAVFTRVQRTNAETANTRQELQSYYLQSQSDSIDFLNFIDQEAESSGIELTTNTPNEEEIDGETYLSVGYELSGNLNRVENFIQKLENLPYVSQLESLSFTKRSGNVWTANVEVRINVLNYETN